MYISDNNVYKRTQQIEETFMVTQVSEEGKDNTF